MCNLLQLFNICFLQTSCCEHWLGLGMVCKQKGIMPCPCISVNYKLAGEDFIRAGYVNYWNPRSLIVNYAVSEYLVCECFGSDRLGWGGFTQPIFSN